VREPGGRVVERGWVEGGRSAHEMVTARGTRRGAPTAVRGGWDSVKRGYFMIEGA
jgi:hypothetical protein